MPRGQDFSESSVGGLLLDMAAYVGDTMSYYLDHQYRELDPVTAVERKNIVRHLQNAGLEIPGPSPAVVKCKFVITVDAIQSGTGEYVPKTSCAPRRSACGLVRSEGLVL